VPADIGCVHYRPKTRAAMNDPRTKRERQQDWDRAARARAAEAVASFRRTMNLGAT
jgi:hypothetical protein